MDWFEIGTGLVIAVLVGLVLVAVL